MALSKRQDGIQKVSIAFGSATKQKLIRFARWKKVGRTGTRMISALGRRFVARALVRLMRHCDDRFASPQATRCSSERDRVKSSAAIRATTSAANPFSQ